MSYKRWTEAETAYIRENCKTMSDAEMGAALKRSAGAVANARRNMRLGKQVPWTQDEEEYLQEMWGSRSIPAIAKHLGRTVNAVKVRVARLGLGPSLMGGEYITFNQLVIAVTGGNSGYTYKMKSWAENRGLPIHTKRVEKCSWRVIYVDEFWDWAEKNRSFIDFSKMEPLALGEEPDWVAEQRRKDFTAFSIQRKDPWTADEDSRLICLLKQHKYGYSELSSILHRSGGAIQRRCTDLGLKERPVKADNHGEGVAWTQDDYDILADGIRHGDSYTMIGQAIGKSEKAVRGKVYFVYLTENADKIRSMMGNRPWGFGAPEPTVKQGATLSRTRTEVRKNLSLLDALLRKRMNELGYEPYWQRHMCMKWDDIKGCGAGCSDCDSCAEFERIKPQYCRVCGDIIIDRKIIKWRVCDRCKTARKKQYQRRWARAHATANT